MEHFSLISRHHVLGLFAPTYARATSIIWHPARSKWHAEIDYQNNQYNVQVSTEQKSGVFKVKFSTSCLTQTQAINCLEVHAKKILDPFNLLGRR